MALAAASVSRQFIVHRGVFRVLSYNVLAEQFENAHASYCSKQLLAWEHRSRMIFDEVVQYKADICMLQEVQSNVYETQIKPLFRAIGYESFYCGRGLEDSQDFGVVLLYNTEKLTCQASRTVRFRDVLDEWWAPAGESNGTTRKAGTFWDKLRDVNEGAVVAQLHSTHSDRSILAAATHLFWDPNFPDVKAAQAAVLCHVMAKFIRDKSPPGRPPAVLMAGDLNSLWRKYRSDAWDRVIPSAPGYLTSGTYELLYNGQLPRTHPDHPFTRRADNSTAQAPFTSGGLMLRSLHMAMAGHEPPVTTKTASFAGCLDYIFFSPTDWQPISYLGMPYDYEAENDAATRDPGSVLLPPLPNRQFPSDHLPIAGDLLLI